MENSSNKRFSLKAGVVAEIKSMQVDEDDYEYVLDCVQTSRGLGVAMSSGRIQVRDFETLAVTCEIPNAHSQSIHELWSCKKDASSSQNLQHVLASCGGDGFVKLWDTRNNSSIQSFSTPSRGEIWTLSLSDHTVATGTDTGVQFFDMRNGRQVGEYNESHIDAVTKVRFHPTWRNHLVSASEDGIACVFDCGITEEEDAIASIINVESAITQISFFGPSLEHIACCTGTETLDLWNLKSAERDVHFPQIRQQCQEELHCPIDYLVNCQYDAAEEKLYVVAGDQNGTIRILCVDQSGRLSHVQSLHDGHKAAIRCMSWTSSSTFYTGGEDSRVCSWTTATGNGATSNKAFTSAQRHQRHHPSPHTKPY